MTRAKAEMIRKGIEDKIQRIIVALLLVCMMLFTSCGESKEQADDSMEIRWIPQYSSATKSVILVPIFVPKGE